MPAPLLHAETTIVVFVYVSISSCPAGFQTFYTMTLSVNEIFLLVFFILA